MHLTVIPTGKIKDADKEKWKKWKSEKATKKTISAGRENGGNVSYSEKVEKERCNKSRAVNYYTETDRTVDVKKKKLRKAKSKKAWKQICRSVERTTSYAKHKITCNVEYRKNPTGLIKQRQIRCKIILMRRKL